MCHACTHVLLLMPIWTHLWQQLQQLLVIHALQVQQMMQPGKCHHLLLLLLLQWQLVSWQRLAMHPVLTLAAT
jgi:hypothetical protein